MASALRLRSQEGLLFPMGHGCSYCMFHSQPPAGKGAGCQLTAGKRGMDWVWSPTQCPAFCFPEMPPEQLLELVLLVLIQVRKPWPRDVK